MASSEKRLIREAFRQGVFARDGFRCRICGLPGRLDAHHITDRNLLPNGGYAVDNGISLCMSCHEKAEHFHSTGRSLPGYSPEELYREIGSSQELARAASARLEGRVRVDER